MTNLLKLACRPVITRGLERREARRAIEAREKLVASEKVALEIEAKKDL